MSPKNIAHCFKKAEFVIPSSENVQESVEQLGGKELQSQMT